MARITIETGRHGMVIVRIPYDPELTVDIPRPKKERKLPDVLSQQEVFRFLEAVENTKHRAIMLLI